ncbi:CsbD family protein [Pseudonocardia sp. CA-107938]|uniref:CsbD family protein n=1 Tax=Pseudonocardia sp. CA-107938 TaxID=3240021 RepID=UPI003D8DB17F
MGLDDKVSNKAEELKGEVKEGYGKATNDPEYEAEGKGEQAKANLKQAGEKVKDTAKSVLGRDKT